VKRSRSSAGKPARIPARIHVTWRVRARPLTTVQVARAAEAALAHGGRAGEELSVVLVDDATLARLHRDWLGDPSPTDVLSFDLGSEAGEPEAGPVGEVVASVECAVRVARERRLPAGRELALYVVHGTLHLCGYDDREPKARAHMRAAEAAVLTRLGMPRARPGGVRAEPRSSKRAPRRAKRSAK
jgi:probable rRNA maturation factor